MSVLYRRLRLYPDPLLVLDLSLDVLDGVRALDLEGDGLAGEGLDEDLHAAHSPFQSLALFSYFPCFPCFPFSILLNT